MVSVRSLDQTTQLRVEVDDRRRGVRRTGPRRAGCVGRHGTGESRSPDRVGRIAALGRRPGPKHITTRRGLHAGASNLATHGRAPQRGQRRRPAPARERSEPGPDLVLCRHPAGGRAGSTPSGGGRAATAATSTGRPARRSAPPAGPPAAGHGGRRSATRGPRTRWGPTGPAPAAAGTAWAGAPPSDHRPPPDAGRASQPLATTGSPPPRRCAGRGAPSSSQASSSSDRGVPALGDRLGTRGGDHEGPGRDRPRGPHPPRSPEGPGEGTASSSAVRRRRRRRAQAAVPPHAGQAHPARRGRTSGRPAAPRPGEGQRSGQAEHRAGRRQRSQARAGSSPDGRLHEYRSDVEGLPHGRASEGGQAGGRGHHGSRSASWTLAGHPDRTGTARRLRGLRRRRGPPARDEVGLDRAREPAHAARPCPPARARSTSRAWG